jgi:hypothetical protein
MSEWRLIRKIRGDHPSIRLQDSNEHITAEK